MDRKNSSLFFCATYPRLEQLYATARDIYQQLQAQTQRDRDKLAGAVGFAAFIADGGSAFMAEYLPEDFEKQKTEKAALYRYLMEVYDDAADILFGRNPQVTIDIGVMNPKYGGLFVPGNGDEPSKIVISEALVASREDADIVPVLLHEVAHASNYLRGKSQYLAQPVYADRASALEGAEEAAEQKATDEALAETYANYASQRINAPSGILNAFLGLPGAEHFGAAPTMHDVFEAYFLGFDNPQWSRGERIYNFDRSTAYYSSPRGTSPAVFHAHQSCAADSQGCIDTMVALIGDLSESPFIRGPNDARPADGAGQAAAAREGSPAGREQPKPGNQGPGAQARKDPNVGAERGSRREGDPRATRGQFDRSDGQTPARGRDQDPQKPSKEGVVGRIVDALLGRSSGPERPGRDGAVDRGSGADRGRGGASGQRGGGSTSGRDAAGNGFSRGDRGGRETAFDRAGSGRGRDSEGVRDQARPGAPEGARNVPGAQGRGNAPANSQVQTEGEAPRGQAGDQPASVWYLDGSRDNGDGTTTYYGTLDTPEGGLEYDITCGGGGCRGSDGNPFVPEDANGNPLDCSGGCRPTDAMVVHTLGAPPASGGGDGGSGSGDGGGGSGSGDDGSGSGGSGGSGSGDGGSGSGDGDGGGGCVGGDGSGTGCGGSGSSGLVRGDSDTGGYGGLGIVVPEHDPNCTDDGCAGAGIEDYVAPHGQGTSPPKYNPNCADGGCAGAGIEDYVAPHGQGTSPPKYNPNCADGGCAGAGIEDYVPRSTNSVGPPPSTPDPKAKTGAKEKDAQQSKGDGNAAGKDRREDGGAARRGQR